MNKLVFSFLAMSLVSPQDEFFSSQWYLKNNGFNIRRDVTEISSYAVMGKAGADLQFPFELNLQAGPRKPVIVAILDTGVDIDHPQLKEAILKSSECDSLGHIPPKNSPDKDGNGYKGDCAGWNFASNTSADGDNQVYDDTGHGTHLSGLIAAKLDQSGIRGINDQIKILPVKIFNKYEIPNHPLRPKMKMMERIQKGLEYAIRKNVDVINLSLGWPSILDSPKIRELFDLAAKKNILVVAAAGNNAHHTTIFPCSYPSVLCVGATTVDGTVAPFSNFGGNVDLMAPGENILSTIPKKITSLYFDEDGYDFKNGTSQASPLVAGSAALLKLALGDLTVNELKARLLSAAVKSNSVISSLYGDVNLSSAIANKPDQFIYPNLKELNTVEVGYPDGRFKFDLKLDKLMPGALSDGQLTLNFGEIRLDQKVVPLTFSSEEAQRTIHISGEVPDFKLSSTQTLIFRLQYGDHQYTFNKELTFALNAEQVGTKVLFEEKVNADSLKSVDNSLQLSSQTMFYAQDTTPSIQSLTFFKAQGSTLKKVLSTHTSTELKLLATVMLGQDLLIIEYFDPTNKKLIFEFWDLQTATLKKSLDMVPDSAVFTLNQSAYLSVGSSLQAVALVNGKIPPSEANKNVFLNSQTAASDHLYLFEENAGKINTYLLDTDFFRKALMKKYQLRFDDAIQPLAVLSQGVVANLETLFVIGKGYQRKVLKVVFKGHDQFKITREYQFPGGAALRLVNFLKKSMLLTQERKDAYLMFDLQSGKFFSYEWNDRNDDLLSPIVSVSGNQLLAQTQNHLVVLGEGQSSSLPLKRFSFLPGELFSEMFTSVEVGSGDQALPGLFIDGTMISEKHLGLVLWDGEKIVKPILYQEKLPENCRVMNPQRMDGFYQMILFCKSSAGEPYLLNRKLSP
jgi:hypothetical protein